MWEHHRSGISGNTRFPEDRGGQACRVDTQQHEICTAHVEPIRRQMHLLRCRQMDEPIHRQRFGSKLTVLLRRPPLLGTADMDQHSRQGSHTATLPRRQLGVTVRHDTPVNP